MKYDDNCDQWVGSTENIHKIWEFEKAENLIHGLQFQIKKEIPDGLKSLSKTLFDKNSIKYSRCYFWQSKNKIGARWICIDSKWWKDGKLVELCHKDFCNLRENIIGHSINHKMACILYNTEKSEWILTRKIISQNNFQNKEIYCSICHALC